MDISLATLAAILQSGGTVAVLLFLIYAFFKGWLYTAAAYGELKERCERAETGLAAYRELAIRGSSTAQTAAQISAEVVSAVLAAQGKGQP